MPNFGGEPPRGRQAPTPSSSAPVGTQRKTISGKGIFNGGKEKHGMGGKGLGKGGLKRHRYAMAWNEEYTFRAEQTGTLAMFMFADTPNQRRKVIRDSVRGISESHDPATSNPPD